MVWLLNHYGPYSGYQVIKVMNREPTEKDSADYIKSLPNGLENLWVMCDCKGLKCPRATKLHFMAPGQGYVFWEEREIT